MHEEENDTEKTRWSFSSPSSDDNADESGYELLQVCSNEPMSFDLLTESLVVPSSPLPVDT